MSELSLPQLFYSVIFIALPFLGGLLATKFRIPKMIGYIVSGMLLGIFIHGKSESFLPIFAHIGLILLLFTVGLEINLENFKRFSKIIITIGLLQVFVTLLIFFIITVILGMAFIEALIISFAFSLSSTAVVSKIIQEKGEENSLVGGMTLGILILQDIVVIPFMMLISSFKGGANMTSVIAEVFVSLIRAGVILSLIYLIAQKIIPFIYNKIALTSRELLNLLTILIIVSAILIFSFLGLSPAIAAFVAGMIIGGTMEHYQIFTQIRPLRDIFTILFFVFLGATIDISQILPKLPLIFILSLLLILIKFIVIFSLFVYFKFHSKTAFSTAILLSQIGEFAFIVLHQSKMQSLITDDIYLITIAVTLLTIALSPILTDRKERLYLALRRFTQKYAKPLDSFLSYKVDREPLKVEALSISGHVVLCGYGRVGSYIGRALTMADIPFIAIDIDYHVVDEYRKKGINILYGDPTDIDMLEYAQLGKALAIISALPDAFSQEMIILNTKRLNENAMIITRVGKEAYQRRMKDLGAGVVIQPEFEAALSIVKKIMLGYKMPKEDIIGKVKRLKIEHGMI